MSKFIEDNGDILFAAVEVDGKRVDEEYEYDDEGNVIGVSGGSTSSQDGPRDSPMSATTRMRPRQQAPTPGAPVVAANDSPVRREQEKRARAGDNAVPVVSETTHQPLRQASAMYDAEAEQMEANRLADGHYAFDPVGHVYTHDSRFVVRTSPSLTADVLHTLPRIKEGTNVADYGAAVVVLPREYALRLFRASAIKKLEVEYADPEGEYNTELSRMRIAGAHTLGINAKRVPFPMGVTVVELDESGKKIVKVPSALNERVLPSGDVALDVLTPGVVEVTKRRLFDHTSEAKKVLIADVYDVPHPDDMWFGILPAPGNNKMVPADSVLIQGGDLKVVAETQAINANDKKYYVFDAALVQSTIDKHQHFQQNLNIVHGERLAFIFSRADELSVEAQKLQSNGESPNADAAYGACGKSDGVCAVVDLSFAVQFPYTVKYIKSCLLVKTAVVDE